MVVRPPRIVLRLADDQQVMHGHPSRGGLPRRLQHHRPRDVPPVLRDVGVARAEPERTSGPVQQRREHTRRVGAWQAQPLDRPVRCDQAILLTIRQQSVLGNGRKHAHWSSTSPQSRPRGPTLMRQSDLNDRYTLRPHPQEVSLGSIMGRHL